MSFRSRTALILALSTKPTPIASMPPGKLLFPLIEAVQELSAANDNLAARLAALEAVA